MKTVSKMGFVALAMATLAACGSARLVSRDQAGGVYALEGDRGKAMEAARGEMSAHCGPNNFQITSEGEVVIGEDTQYGENQDVSKNGRHAQTQGGSSTRAATEWRVSYQCNGMAPMAMPEGGPPPAPDGGPGAPGY